MGPAQCFERIEFAMTFELDISTMNLVEAIQAKFEEVRVPIRAAMAGRFAEICRENIGEGFVSNRPAEWPDLKPKYAKRVGRENATLFLTPDEAARVGGESGKLYNSIQVDPYGQDAAIVFSDCEYAAKQQKTRPFFPMLNGELTPYAIAEVTAAAQREAERLLT